MLPDGDYQIVLEARAGGEQQQARVPLTIRESEVVELLRGGATTSEIANELAIAPVTVRRHISSIEHKLGVRSRAAVQRLLR